MKAYSFEEVEKLINIGFCQSRFYNPDIWEQATDVMDCLANRTDFVVHRNFGRGKGKFNTTEKLDALALGGGAESGFLAKIYCILLEQEIDTIPVPQELF